MLTSALITAALLTASPSRVPLKVFESVPAGEGQWRIEVTSSGQKIPVVATCTDALADMNKKTYREEAIAYGKDGACTTELVTNTRSKAEIRTACKEERMRIRIVSEGDKAWSIEVYDLASPKAPKVTARYEYQGACTGKSGDVKLEKDSPLCKQLQTQMQMLRPEMCAAQDGDAKAKCLSKIEDARKKLESMCN